LKRLS
jgi:hypothetical protein